jgi:nucleoside 2-deoxyribosyltransferase
MHKIYLCGSIANAQINRTIAGVLSGAGYDVFDPCLIVPHHSLKTEFPGSVYAQCKCAIERCDVLFVFLDSYGKDSAWEIGFARGLGKYVVGVVAGTSLFLEDWMVKYTLDRILVIENSWLASAIDSEEWSTIRPLCETASIKNIPNIITNALAAKRE